MSVWKKVCAGSVLTASFTLSGCDEITTQRDVEQARESYQEEAREASEARQEARKEVQDTRKEALEGVREEEREAEVERRKLQQKEAEFASDQSRADYVERQSRRLDQLEASVGDLKTRSAALAGEAKTSLDRSISAIESKCNEVRDKLNELKSASADEWTAKRDDVELAISHVERQIAEAPRP